MITKKIEIQNKKLLVVGPIYNKIDKLHLLKDLIKEDTIVIFNGDICYPYTKYTDVIERINTLKLFMEGKDCHYVLGDKDLIYISKVLNTHADVCDWLKSQPTAIRFVFENQTAALILHGGILPKHSTWNELSKDLEISFISNDPAINKPWHKTYNGRFGYILSSHPSTKDNLVEKYKHSISLDTNANETDKLVVQELDQNGLGKTLYI